MTKKKAQFIPTNRVIDAFITSKAMAINGAWATEMLAKYAHDIELLEMGVTYEELGIDERRKQNRTIYYNMEGPKQMVAVDFDEEGEPEGGIPKNAIARLRYSGVMQMDDGLSSRGIRSFCSEIESCAGHSNIKGIMVEMDSGGGDPLAGQMLMNAIEDANNQVPVLVYGHFVGSAAIHGILTAQHIMAAGPSSEFGSIGSMAIIDKRVATFYRKNIDSIYSRKSADKNKEWREYLKGNKGPLIQDVTQNDEIFMQLVRDHRPLRGNVDETLRGGMFYAKDAQERGLIDNIGTMREALQRLAVLINSRGTGPNKNQSNMKLNKELIDRVNEICGTKFGEAATQEEVLEGLKDQQTIEEATEAGKEAATKQFEARIVALESAGKKKEEEEEVDEPGEQAKDEGDKGQQAKEKKEDKEKKKEEDPMQAILDRLEALEEAKSSSDTEADKLRKENERLKKKLAGEKIEDEFTQHSGTQHKDQGSSFTGSTEVEFEFGKVDGK